MHDLSKEDYCHLAMVSGSVSNCHQSFCLNFKHIEQQMMALCEVNLVFLSKCVSAYFCLR